jgi:hypothetical protein
MNIIGRLTPWTIAISTLAMLMPIILSANAKQRETIQLIVLSSKTQIHGQHPPDVFEYTDLMFTQVAGKHVTYECDQRGDVCPIMEAGKIYSADRIGNEIYISIVVGKMRTPVKFRQVGSW